MDNQQPQLMQKPKYTKEMLDAVAFNREKDYQWKLDTVFTLNAKEFEVIFNSLLNFINTPFGVGSTLKMLSLYHLMEGKFREAILDGKIKELSKEELEKAMQEVEFEEIKTEKNPDNIATEG